MTRSPSDHCPPLYSRPNCCLSAPRADIAITVHAVDVATGEAVVSVNGGARWTVVIVHNERGVWYVSDGEARAMGVPRGVVEEAMGSSAEGQIAAIVEGDRVARRAA